MALVRRDYMCAMRTVGLPGYPLGYSPGVLRWATNMVVYSLTTGGIADRRNYIPDGIGSATPVPLSVPSSAWVSRR